MLYAIVISTILCPYSKYAIEHIFFKFIKKDFFRKRKNLNNAPRGKIKPIYAIQSTLFGPSNPIWIARTVYINKE
ncbi:colicin E1 family microcin immunity protein [Escherichia coli]|uniref:colicin E1 family microcin immunity protein n=1 Tax=Escherichia coli TaxID=562 RepID=UPI00266CB46D|nr:colicin E1 family microcin immunity protein [Escherichia coli]